MRLRGNGPRLAWTAALVAVTVLGLVESMLRTDAVDPVWVLRWRTTPLLLWALASPAIERLGALVRIDRGWPVRPLAIHAGAFAGWMLLSNLILRMPPLGAEGGAPLLRTAALAAAIHAPPSVLLWALLAVLGHRRARSGMPGGAPAIAPSRDETTEPLQNVLALPQGMRVHVVQRERIRWLEADGDHVRVHTIDGKPRRVRARLGDCETRLGADFVRIHRSTLVNSRYVRELQPYLHGDWMAVLDDGTELRVPRTRRPALERILSSRP